MIKQHKYVYIYQNLLSFFSTATFPRDQFLQLNVPPSNPLCVCTKTNNQRDTHVYGFVIIYFY